MERTLAPKLFDASVVLGGMRGWLASGWLVLEVAVLGVAVLGVAVLGVACQLDEGAERLRPQWSKDPTLRPTLPRTADAEGGVPDLGPFQPRLPTSAGAFGPSLARYGGDTGALTEVEVCAACHEDVAASWARSAHARSSFDNPWYRASIDAFREARGNSASRFCGGCHDPALVSTGALDEPVRPDDESAHVGVVCLVCHSTQRTTGDGNASMEVLVRDPLIPDPADDAQVAAHVARMTPPSLWQPQLCGSCHRSFVGGDIDSPHHIAGIDDIGAWKASAYAGSHARRLEPAVEEATCAGCHMPMVDAPRGDMAADDNGIRFHGVPGAHHPMASRSTEQRTATESMLKEAATADIARVQVNGAWHSPDELDSLPAGDVAIDVVVRNVGAGHRFPGGTRDLQDTWLEVRVLEGKSRDESVVLQAGTRYAIEDDATAFRLRAVVLGEDGAPESMHRVDRFRAPAFDRTIAPRDALVVRYRGSLDRPVATPIFEVRLRHRRHDRAFQKFACSSQRTPRGRAFDRFTASAVRSPVLQRPILDACAPEPIVDIARIRVGPQSQSPRDRWSRLYDLALGLSHEVQERLDDVRPVLAEARAWVPADDSFAAAMLDVLGGSVAARQGRVQEALRLADRAQRVAGEHPAIDRVRGEAHAQVWQWGEAAKAFASVAEGAPGDVASWRDLARARGSVGDDRGALDAARIGLLLGPRDPDLLRSQHLALERLGRPDSQAREAFLRYRSVDEAPAMLRRCQSEVPDCNRDRQPIPTIPLH